MIDGRKQRLCNYVREIKREKHVQLVLPPTHQENVDTIAGQRAI